jgi:hypothetical protein
LKFGKFLENFAVFLNFVLSAVGDGRLATSPPLCKFEKSGLRIPFRDQGVAGPRNITSPLKVLKVSSRIPPYFRHFGAPETFDGAAPYCSPAL